MNCTLCSEISGDHYSQHSGYDHLVDSGEHLLISGREAVCIPSLGPLNEYHTLIAPIKHTTSIAAIENKLAAKEVAEIKRAISEYNRAKFQMETTFFEHGTGFGSDVACACIEHAHLHAIATNIDILGLLKSNYNFSNIESQAIFQNRTLAESGYYYYEHPPNTPVVCSQRLEPQFFRILYWRVFGKWTPWNWRIHHNIPLVRKVIANYQTLQSHFTSTTTIE